MEKNPSAPYSDYVELRPVAGGSGTSFESPTLAEGRDPLKLSYHKDGSADTHLQQSPIEAGEKGYSTDNDRSRRLHREFHPAKQLRKLLISGLSRWLLTAILIVCLYVTLWHYSSKKVMTSAKKRVFNAIVTGLSIALGLSISSGLKAMALEVRWWILSHQKRSLREVDLILHSGSPSQVFMLALVAPRLKVITCVFIWLLLHIASQVGVATLGLTYSTDTNHDIALTYPGNVSIANMTGITTYKVVSSSSQVIGALQYTANSYGMIALAYNFQNVSTIPVPYTLLTTTTPNIYFGMDYYQYVFYESTPDESASTISSIATNRSINSTGTCSSWPVAQGGNGTSLNITILLDSNGTAATKSIPITAGDTQTTYITGPSQSCGTGCSRIYALEASLTNPWYYECNVSVSQVANATRPEHQVGQDLQDMASAAIALQGYAASSLSNDTDLQFQTYPGESIYGAPQNGSSESMGLLMAQFAIGAVAVTAQFAPSITLPGNQPLIGVVLNVNQWKYVHLILGLIAGIQLMLSLVSTFVANRVVVKENSHLAIARLLRPIVDRLGASGTIASAEEICDALDKDEKYVYSIYQTSSEKLFHLEMGKQPSRRPFPKGIYD
ncbi:hypothetical protein B0J14DRAFT_532392 [Halenospora varia]|nr:hypothetical protein B0J14DRAFT_532392 [Halenospora varia]